MNYRELTDELHGLRAHRVEEIRCHAEERTSYLNARRAGLIAAGQTITDIEKTNEIIERLRETIMSCNNWLQINGWER